MQNCYAQDKDDDPASMKDGFKKNNSAVNF